MRWRRLPAYRPKPTASRNEAAAASHGSIDVGARSALGAWTTLERPPTEASTRARSAEDGVVLRHRVSQRLGDRRERLDLRRALLTRRQMRLVGRAIGSRERAKHVELGLLRAARRVRQSPSPSDRACQRVAQLQHREANARFDRAERLFQPRGNLRVGQTLEVRQLDCGALQHGQLVERRADASHVFRREHLRVDRRTGVHDLTDSPIVGRARPDASVGPQPIDRTAPRQRQQPRPDRPARRAVACRLAPRLREHVLHDVFGFGRVAENPQRQRIDRPGVTVIKLRHGITVAPAMRASAA